MGQSFKKYNDIYPSLAIITLNINGQLKHSLWNWIEKQIPIMYCLHENPFKFEDVAMLKLNDEKQYIMQNPNRRKLEW